MDILERLRKRLAKLERKWVLLGAALWMALMLWSLWPHLGEHLPYFAHVTASRIERQRVASGSPNLWEAKALLRTAAAGENEALVLWHIPNDWERTFAFYRFSSGLYPLRIIFVPLSSPPEPGLPLTVVWDTPAIWAKRVLGGVPDFLPHVPIGDLDTSAINFALVGSNDREIPNAIYRVTERRPTGLRLAPAEAPAVLTPWPPARRPWLWPLGLVSVLGLGAAFLFATGLSQHLRCASPPGLAVSFLSGMGISMYLMMAASLLEMNWSLSLLASAAAAATGLGLCIGYTKRHPGAARPARPSLGLADRMGVALVCAVLLFAVGRSFIPLPPLHNWDAWALWDLKSRACWLARGIPFSYLADERFGFTNRDYPMALPMLQAYLAYWAGGLDSLLARLLSPAFHACLIVLTAELLLETGIRKGRWLLAGLLGLTPILLNQASNGYADIVLAACMLGCLLLLLKCLRKAAPLWSVAWLGAIAASVKEEGAVFAFACLLVAGLHWRKNARSLRLALRTALLLVALLLPWRTVTVSLGLETINRVPDVGHIISSHALPRLGMIMKAAALEMIGPGLTVENLKSRGIKSIHCRCGEKPGFCCLVRHPIAKWMLLWHAFFVLLALGWRGLRSPPQSYLLLILLIQWASYVAAYAFTSLPLPWHLATSLDRLLMQTAPLALILGASLAFGKETQKRN